MYFTGDVAFPFGHGLGYTTFEYSEPRPDRPLWTLAGRSGSASTFTNTGPVAGAEVVQLYAATPDAPAARQRPAQRLVAFRKVTLPPGQKTTVDLVVPVRDLAFFDEAAGKYTVDTGRYELRLGPSSRDVRRRATVTVTGALPEVPATLTAQPRGASDPAIAARTCFIRPASSSTRG